MGRKTILLLLVGIFTAYYVYTPLPDNIEEPWKLTGFNLILKTILNVALVGELLGINHFITL
ncbi:hypothetical protein QTO34_014780 [Cnephaeus nilssonii]|uniref:Uncharacterized protein n=1 Tax=Cnephaeus nilssonii TaxID=3371016 RepID=A0AA40I712_CNENI|nr:hypothetical protein QTO34_014780 [Eptesicus nilssonii]